MPNFSDRGNIGMELAIMIRRWRAKTDARLTPLGLTHARWVPLRHLSHADGSMPQRKLVEETGIEGPSLVRILDELARLGFIERRDCEADRRTKIVHLTGKAELILGEIAHRVDRLRDEVLEGISDQDIMVFLKVLAQISHNLENIAT